MKSKEGEKGKKEESSFLLKEEILFVGAHIGGFFAEKHSGNRKRAIATKVVRPSTLHIGATPRLEHTVMSFSKGIKRSKIPELLSQYRI